MNKNRLFLLIMLGVLVTALLNPCMGQVTWTNHTVASSEGGLGTNDVYAVILEPNTDGNVIWAGGRPHDNNGWVGGLSRYNVTTGEWTHFNSQNSALPHDFITELEFDSKGNLWIGTRGGGLARFKPPYGENDWTAWGDGSDIGYTRIYDIVVDSEDNIWMGHGPPPPDGNSPKAMSVFDGNSTWQTFGTPTLEENAVYTMVFDGEGKMWCATKRSYIYIFEDGGTPFDTGDDTWTHITDADGIAAFPFNSAAGTFVNGQLWFGHDMGGGVDVWDGNDWTNHYFDRWFRAVTHDWRGYVWCGEKRGHVDAWGLFIYDGSDWENIQEFDGLPWNVINMIRIDNPNGNVWIGHGNPSYDEGGLTLLQGKVPPQPPSPVEQDESLVVREFRLIQNNPNPFNPETAIGYQLPAVSEVKLNIFNIRGQKVRSMVSEKQPAGTYSVIWDGRDDSGSPMDSGIYFYRLTAGNRMQMKKMTLLK